MIHGLLNKDMKPIHPPLEEWDLPSDADMLNWIESKRASVSLGKEGWLCIVPVGIDLKTGIDIKAGEPIGLRVVKADTLRAVLEKAMEEYQ